MSNYHQGNAESISTTWKHFAGIDSKPEACRRTLKNVESRSNTFSPTNLPFLYRIQVG